MRHRQLVLFDQFTAAHHDNDVVKDSVLAQLGKSANVAQFVSYSPKLKQRHSLIRGYEPDYGFADLHAGVSTLLSTAPERQVNVRSFDPRALKGRDFFYGLGSADDVVAKVAGLAATGLHTIVNETVDIHDGGVSGVAHGEVIEFAPDSTPRCVEEPGVTSLERRVGLDLLGIVYGFKPDLNFTASSRVEFSIHPIRRGYRNTHTIIWEMENMSPPSLIDPLPRWPSTFSRFCGDKAFGLLVAHLAGFDVPATLVIPRHIAPFHFGTSTTSGEYWLRTAPREQVPGKFTTCHGWVDPFKLLSQEDPEHAALSAVLCQHGIDSLYSGAATTVTALGASTACDALIEGVAGSGEGFMLGREAPIALPCAVQRAVQKTFTRMHSQMGAIRFEWGYDGKRVWIVQLHREARAESSWMIYAGEASVFHRFETSRGLSELRDLVETIRDRGEGIALVGNVGRTSHMCDLLRQARIPSVQQPAGTTAHDSP